MGNDGASKIGCLGLDEALEQLILLGVCKSSTNESELVEKAKRGSLKIHLTAELSEGFRLIEAKYVKGLMKKIPVSDYSYEGTLDCSGLTLDDIADERYEVEGVDWLVTADYVVKDDAVIDTVVIKKLPSYTCFIPMNVVIEREKLIITRSNWLSYIDEDGFDDAENLSALQMDGVDYFVVKDLSETMLFDDVERVHELNGYTGVKYCLSTDVVDASIDRNNKVVTADELLAFEKAHSCMKESLQSEPLKEGVQTDKIPKARDALRIEDLKKFIGELALMAKSKDIKFDALDMSCSKDMLLAEMKDWEKQRGRRKEEKLWELKMFPKLTWDHPERKGLCDNFKNRSNRPDPDFFKKIRG